MKSLNTYIKEALINSNSKIKKFENYELINQILIIVESTNLVSNFKKRKTLFAESLRTFFHTKNENFSKIKSIRVVNNTKNGLTIYPMREICSHVYLKPHYYRHERYIRDIIYDFGYSKKFIFYSNTLCLSTQFTNTNEYRISLEIELE